MEIETNDNIQQALRNKYGDNYDLGCELVARWVRYRLRHGHKSIQKRWQPDFVKKLNRKTQLTALEDKALNELIKPVKWE